MNLGSFLNILKLNYGGTMYVMLVWHSPAKWKIWGRVNWVSPSLGLALILKIATDVYCHILVKNPPPIPTSQLWKVFSPTFLCSKKWIKSLFSILAQVLTPFYVLLFLLGLSNVFLSGLVSRKHGKALEWFQSDDLVNYFLLFYI